MFSKPRVIPVLTIIENDLVKTEKYLRPRYLGDPVKAVKIFNNNYVYELNICNIRAGIKKNPLILDY